ncbi:MAG: VOC family protein [Deltaproteobacteria bacterium]|nr:VOC family protein [Deltaproteobacteria bacterium]MBI3001364.1 VOC family protein [Deltaproteobacteria bacterium]
MNLAALDYVILIVEDLDRAVKFYREVLGLPLSHRSGEYAQFATGGTRFGLYTRKGMGQTLGAPLAKPAEDAPGFEIGFKVADVDKALQELVASGATPAMPPTTRPWGQRTAYLRDPDGHLIELAQDLRSS